MLLRCYSVLFEILDVCLNFSKDEVCLWSEFPRLFSHSQPRSAIPEWVQFLIKHWANFSRRRGTRPFNACYLSTHSEGNHQRKHFLLESATPQKARTFETFSHIWYVHVGEVAQGVWVKPINSRKCTRFPCITINYSRTIILVLFHEIFIPGPPTLLTYLMSFQCVLWEIEPYTRSSGFIDFNARLFFC